MDIRDPRKEDIEPITRLLLELQNVHVAEYPERYRPVSFEEATEVVRSRFAGKESFYIVAEHHGDVLGYIYVQTLKIRATSFTPDRNYAYISEVAVDSSVRMTGIGRSLIEATCKRCKDQKLDGLELQVGDFNDSALAFFKTVGFEVINRRMSLTV